MRTVSEIHVVLSMASRNESASDGKNCILSSSKVEKARNAIDFLSSLSVPDSGQRSEETGASGPTTSKTQVAGGGSQGDYVYVCVFVYPCLSHLLLLLVLHDIVLVVGWGGTSSLVAIHL